MTPLAPLVTAFFRKHKKAISESPHRNVRVYPKACVPPCDAPYVRLKYTASNAGYPQGRSMAGSLELEID